MRCFALRITMCEKVAREHAWAAWVTHRVALFREHLHIGSHVTCRMSVDHTLGHLLAWITLWVTLVLRLPPLPPSPLLASGQRQVAYVFVAASWPACCIILQILLLCGVDFGYAWVPGGVVWGNYSWLPLGVLGGTWGAWCRILTDLGSLVKVSRGYSLAPYGTFCFIGPFVSILLCFFGGLQK